jgi:hypothetical protein
MVLMATLIIMLETDLAEVTPACIWGNGAVVFKLCYSDIDGTLSNFSLQDKIFRYINGNTFE